MDQPTPLIDVKIVEGALINAAPFYDCQMRHGAGGYGAVQIANVNAELDSLGVTPTTARVFAQGLTSAFGIFYDAGAAQHLTPEAIRNAALLPTEALRRSGDLTDEMIATVCRSIRANEQELQETAAEGLRIVKEHFKRFPLAPGSLSNN